MSGRYRWWKLKGWWYEDTRGVQLGPLCLFWHRAPWPWPAGRVVPDGAWLLSIYLGRHVIR